MKKQIAAILLCLLLMFSAAGMAETNADRAETVICGILNYKAAQSGTKNAADWATHALPGTMGAGGEWYLIGLHQRGFAELQAGYDALRSYTESAKVRAASTRQKLALALLPAGEASFITSTLADSIGKQGVMSWAWGLHLLNNGCESTAYTAEEIISRLLSMQKQDGGWAVTGSYSDADVTAMTLQALAPHRGQEAVAQAVEKAVTCLSEKQLASGGFSSYGVENAESAAQVIIALCALEIDPFADARFVREGQTMLDALMAFRLEDGSFCHEKGGEYSESATAQAFLAMTAYERFCAGKGSLYVLDDSSAASAGMKTKLGYQPVAAAVIGGLALIACIALLLAGKRHPKNFLAVAIAAAVLIAFVFLTDFQSADEYYSTSALQKKDAAGTVTLSIRCDMVAGRAAHIPEDGVLLADKKLPIAEDDTVYDLLTDAARACGIHMESSGADGLMYVHGIGNLYEFDYGDLSGWVFMVNGESSSVGCDQRKLVDGDRVEWHYTLELGRDVY